MQLMGHESSSGPGGFPVDPDVRVGMRIAQARHEAALTQRALADQVGVRLWMVDQWESGGRAVPSDRLGRIAAATKRSEQWLVTGVEGPSAGRTVREVAVEELGSPEFDVEYEQGRQLLDEQLADVERRRAALNAQEESIQEARRTAERRLVELEAYRLNLAERERAVTLRETSADLLTTALTRSHGEDGGLDVAKRLAELDERTRQLAERSSELDERERRLTDTAIAAARRAAETLVRKASDQARSILEEALRERERGVVDRGRAELLIRKAERQPR